MKTKEAGVERMRALVESRAGSENDLILSQSELEEARIARSTASARLRSLQIGRSKDETDYWVLASRNGTVVQLDARPGSLSGRTAARRSPPWPTWPRSSRSPTSRPARRSSCQRAPTR